MAPGRLGVAPGGALGAMPGVVRGAVLLGIASTRGAVREAAPAVPRAVLRRISGAARACSRTCAGAVAAAALLAAGCIQDDGRRFNPIRELTEVSVSQEREIGYELDRELEKHLTFIDDPVVLGFLFDVGQDIVSRIEPQPFLYRFRLVVDPSLNAFAVPGGYVYFHTGTVLAAGSLDELAGVMSHEIGHVKGRHYAELRRRTAVPDLLASLAAIGAAVASGEPGAAVLAQGANVAFKLRFTRELEADADRLAGIFMTRAGYDPAGLGHFFERLIERRERAAADVPPYLYSHPAVEDRIESVRQAGERLKPVTEHDPDLSDAFRDAQARLELLVESGRTTYTPPRPPRAPATSGAAGGEPPGGEDGAGGMEATRGTSGPAGNAGGSDALLERASARADAGDLEGALEQLDRAAELGPYDPEVPFRRARILESHGRLDAAIDAYRRTLRLDPTTALVHYRLGLAYKERGDRHRAALYLEQAARRFGDTGTRRRAAEWEIEKLTFPVVTDAGLSDRVPTSSAAFSTAGTLAEPRREAFPSSAERIVWWARLGARFRDAAGKLHVRWSGPTGAVEAEATPEKVEDALVAATLELAGRAESAGRWEVVVTLDDDVIDRRSFEIRP